jgi:hypothetical protein
MGMVGRASLRWRVSHRFDSVGDQIMRKILTLGAAALCLLVVDWFIFHDFREPHTVRDYLTLLASIMVFFCFGNELIGRAGRSRI